MARAKISSSSGKASSSNPARRLDGGIGSSSLTGAECGSTLLGGALSGSLSGAGLTAEATPIVESAAEAASSSPLGRAGDVGARAGTGCAAALAGTAVAGWEKTRGVCGACSSASCVSARRAGAAPEDEVARLGVASRARKEGRSGGSKPTWVISSEGNNSGRKVSPDC